MKHGSLADRRRGFQIHAIVFVVAMVIMFVVNYFTGPPFWVAWALASWGIGLLAHWFFGVRPAAGVGTS